MKNLFITFRSFFKRGGNNYIKILSLAIGLAMGLVLIAKVYYEQTFDSFFPDNERIYQIRTNYSDKDKAWDPYGQVSGGVAPGMKTEIPEVEVATRFWPIYEARIVTKDKNKYSCSPVFADNSLFEIFSRPIIVGDPKQVLTKPMQVMISDKIAKRMGGIEKVMNMMVEVEGYPGKTLTIGGVFKALPLNSHLEYDFCVSMPSLPQFFGYDGTMNWMGNDGYRGYVKLREGVDPESLAPAIRQMQERHQPLEEIEKAGIHIGYSFYSLMDIHKNSPEIKMRSLLLSVIAFAILFAAIMNYILIVISSLVNRSKEMAVSKCYGASEKNIYGKMLLETLVDMIIALLIAVLLIVVFRNMIETLLGSSILSLLNPQSIILLVGVCFIIFLITAIIPANLYSRTPVAMAFRRFNENRRQWKLVLLFFQFAAAGFFATLLMIVALQYDYMVNDNPGYNYRDLGGCYMGRVQSSTRLSIMEEVGRLPEVAAVATSEQVPIAGTNGNQLSLPGENGSLFNIVDMYEVGNGYFDFMQIPVIEGVSFRENVTSSHEVMISRACRDKLLTLTDWSDGVIGKGICISEHSQNENDAYTICGVYDDIRIGVIGDEDDRPSIMFYDSRPLSYMLVRFVEQTPEAIQKVADIVEQQVPDQELFVYSYTHEITNRYRQSKLFRDQVLLGGLIAILITIIGLIGYTNDEMNRRRRETAIRKVNGATISDVLLLFVKNISWIAIPALILGGGLAAYVAVDLWLVKFADKILLSPMLFVAGGCIVLVIILLAVILNCYKAASENPADTVKTE